MVDMAMCEGDNCPMKDKCYRHTAIAAKYRQTYFIESPYNEGKCSHFLDNTQYSKVGQYVSRARNNRKDHEDNSGGTA